MGKSEKYKQKNVITQGKTRNSGNSQDPAKNLTAQGFLANALCQVAKNRSKLVEAYIML